jgi:NAD(P)H dehydrogenase (quinone)
MKSLIVLAHPEPTSYNATLARVALETLQSQDHEVRVSDLYAKAFAAAEHARHYTLRKDPARFDAQAEQRFSAALNALPPDVQSEVDDLLWADLVVFQFPLWWFGMPAILKGWMDRVFVYGRLYSGSKRLYAGVCRGKRAVLSVTAGSSADACAHNGQEGDTRLHLWPINYALHYVGFTVLEPVIITDVRGGATGQDSVDQARYLVEQLRRHRDSLADIDAIPPIPFNTAHDWDDRRRLKPQAPEHSPFIRHRSDWRPLGGGSVVADANKGPVDRYRARASFGRESANCPTCRLRRENAMSLSTDSLHLIPSTWFTHFRIWGSAPRCLGKSVSRWMNASAS